MRIWPVAASGAAKKPAANNNESPGRNGKKTTPVSMKTIRKTKPSVGATPIAIQPAIGRTRVFEQIGNELDESHGLNVLFDRSSGVCFSISLIIHSTGRQPCQ